MAYIHGKPRGLDYQPCRYGGARINFRGPKKDLGAPYIAFIGGSETYGKFVKRPFPELVEEDLGITGVNLGCMNAGVDAFLQDPEILGIAIRAEVTVVQVMGAQNLSNRLYRVHPRRNDRFIAATDLMKSVFKEVDFTEYNFTRHMLYEVAHLAEDRFSFVRDELRTAWMARMTTLLDQIIGRKLLLWFADHALPEEAPGLPGADPWFVDKGMMDSLRDKVDAIVQVRVSEDALNRGEKGKVFDPLERPVADLMFGPDAHKEAAAALAPVLGALAPTNKKTDPRARVRQ